jgi:hypothetical protein
MDFPFFQKSHLNIILLLMHQYNFIHHAYPLLKSLAKKYPTFLIDIWAGVQDFLKFTDHVIQRRNV